MTDLRPTIAAFWQFFRKQQSSLAGAGSADSPEYDAILGMLQKIDPELYFEFALAPNDNDLVITADGKKELFALVDLIVAQAPPIPGWKVYALKPKLGFPLKTRWEALELKISEVRFEPLTHRVSGKFGLRLFVPGISDAEISAAHNAILRALDHGIGERAAAELIAFSEVLPLHRASDPAELHPLADLEKYLPANKK